MARPRVKRRWHVGIVSCDDVRAMQKQVNTYRTALGTSIDLLKSPGVFDAAANTWTPRDLGTVGPHSAVAWKDLGERCSQFEEESCAVGLFAGSQYDRGRGLITELDGWRDVLAGMSAPSLPAPVVVPQSDVSLFGGIAPIALLALAVLLLHEVR